jgi:hypothetical protein
MNRTIRIPIWMILLLGALALVILRACLGG